MTEGRLVYIASPYAGDVERNVAFAKAACRYAMEQGYVPVAAHLMYPQFLDDQMPEERRLGTRMGLRVLAFCDEVWLCGEQMSDGMKEEEAKAKRLRIPIRKIAATAVQGFQEQDNRQIGECIQGAGEIKLC